MAKGRSRRGFTLVELLIVISIMAVLLLLTVQVMGALLTNAREAATQTTIRKVQRMLNERAEALDRLMQRTGYLQSTSEYTGTALALSAGDQNLQKILARKLLAKKYFPQRAAEVYTALQPNVAPSWSNGDILYDFLTQSNTLGSFSVGADAFSSAEAKDTNGNAQPEFIDAWGNPLRFYRWPTRLFRRNQYWANATNPNPIDAIDLANVKVLLSTLPSFTGNPNIDLARDPDDPLQKCTRFNPSGSAPNNIDFENLGGAGGFHTPATYHIMLIVSAGPDGVLGLYEPTDLANNGHLGAVNTTLPDAILDDVTFLNVRAGGK